MLGNQIEMMAFGKSGWHVTEVHEDPTTGSQTIYMGKCAARDGSASAPAWCIKRVTVANSGNTQTITEQYADGDTLFDNVWDDRTELNYSYLN